MIQRWAAVTRRLESSVRLVPGKRSIGSGDVPSGHGQPRHGGSGACVEHEQQHRQAGCQQRQRIQSSSRLGQRARQEPADVAQADVAEEQAFHEQSQVQIPTIVGTWLRSTAPRPTPIPAESAAPAALPVSKSANAVYATSRVLVSMLIGVAADSGRNRRGDDPESAIRPTFLASVPNSATSRSEMAETIDFRSNLSGRDSPDLPFTFISSPD